MSETTAPIRIDFVSDVSCPWCAIGLQALEQAIARVGEDASVELHFQPFELNPALAAEGEDAIEHLTAKYRSEEHKSELQSLMRISYSVFCLKKKKNPHL